jgi:peptide/nickel transport system substrate-binding protein
LRKGIQFHDGSPFNAEALAWSLNRIKNPETGSPHTWKLALLEKIEVMDEYTVRLHFKKPYPFLRVALTGSTGRAGTVVPKSAVDKWGSEFGVHPVGTGPFRFVDWIKNDRIVLERNTNYFEIGQDNKPLPYLDRVEFRLVADMTTAITALESGELDGLSTVPFHFVERLRKNPNLVLDDTVGGNWTHVTFNTTRPPFDDVNLRRAVAYGLNREALIRQVYAGGAIPAHGPISPPMSGFYSEKYDLGKTGQGYDLALAKKYLAQSRHAGGVEVTLLTRGEEEFPQVATVVKSQLEPLGIKVKIEVLDVPSFNKRFEKGEFDIVTWHWVADLDPDETLYPELHTGEKWNSGKWSNPEFDALVSEAQATEDMPRRVELYRKAEAIIADQCPVAVLVHKKEYKVFNKRVRGFVQIPADLVDLHRVWIER